MIVDFFKNECRTTTTEQRFGICDDDDKADKTPAYINTDDESKWIAVVINDNAKEVIFTAIDNCIEVLRASGETESRCDVMLTTDELLILVELKNKASDWKSSGIEQIESTLIRLIENHEAYYYSFKKRKAYVANKRHPSFHVVENATMRRFSTQYKIWLDLQGTINVS